MSVGKLRPVRGTRDLLSDEFCKFKHIQDTAQEIGERYGFLPVATPIFEFQEVFSKTLGDASDIVGKEMYSFVDKGNDVLVLRPELTASVARLLMCERLQLPARLFAAGPVFRYERPQKCRQRQFHQINYECFGIGECTADAEIIALAYSILGVLDLHNKTKLEINSLGNTASMLSYRESLLKYLDKYQEDLSEDSRRRLHINPLRILDSKNSKDIAILSDAPYIADFYDVESQGFFEGLMEHLSDLSIPCTVNPKLVRGLDYYCGTVFEFKTTCLGSQDAVIAGGRYDGLVSMMGGAHVPAVGFAGGVERLASLMEYCKVDEFSIAILPLDSDSLRYAMRFAYELREMGTRVFCEYEIKSLKIGLKRADKLGVDLVLILGEEEIDKAVVTCRNMITGVQEEVGMTRLKVYISECLTKNPEGEKLATDFLTFGRED